MKYGSNDVAVHITSLRYRSKHVWPTIRSSWVAGSLPRVHGSRSNIQNDDVRVFLPRAKEKWENIVG